MRVILSQNPFMLAWNKLREYRLPVQYLIKIKELLTIQKLIWIKACIEEYKETIKYPFHRQDMRITWLIDKSSHKQVLQMLFSKSKKIKSIHSENKSMTWQQEQMPTHFKALLSRHLSQFNQGNLGLNHLLKIQFNSGIPTREY